MNVIPHFFSFFSEWYDKFITLNYEVDEYGRILYKHFRHKTRKLQGYYYKRRDFANRFHYVLK
jgi:trehalose-6-phosphatase